MHEKMRRCLRCVLLLNCLKKVFKVCASDLIIKCVKSTEADIMNESHSFFASFFNDTFILFNVCLGHFALMKGKIKRRERRERNGTKLLWYFLFTWLLINQRRAGEGGGRKDTLLVSLFTGTVRKERGQFSFTMVHSKLLIQTSCLDDVFMVFHLCDFVSQIEQSKFPSQSGFSHLPAAYTTSQFQTSYAFLPTCYVPISSVEQLTFIQWTCDEPLSWIILKTKRRLMKMTSLRSQNFHTLIHFRPTMFI